ncbi:MAG: hypothetical protein Q8P56_05115, partial [Candidatus Uhrbacteria bacterium]|nr:hypothetical protein [Candidatus Uhrbacteria bacterium]
MKEPVNKFLSVLPLFLVALLVMVGFLWYTGRIALNFEPLTTYANPLLGVSFRYPTSWKPDGRYGMIGDVSGRYTGENGFFGVDALSTDQNLETITRSIAEHKLKPYGQNPKIISLKAGQQEARAIIPSK